MGAVDDAQPGEGEEQTSGYGKDDGHTAADGAPAGNADGLVRSANSVPRHAP